MADVSVQQALLNRARDYAGGVSYLARRIGIGVHSLDAMLHGREAIPSWVFVKAMDFIHDAEMRNESPPGFPPDWRDISDGPQPD